MSNSKKNSDFQKNWELYRDGILMQIEQCSNAIQFKKEEIILAKRVIANEKLQRIVYERRLKEANDKVKELKLKGAK